MTISIEPLSGDTGFAIDDHIEQRRCQLFTSRPVTPVSTADHEFPYPLDTAVEVTVEKLTIGNVTSGYVRTPDGELVREINHLSEFSLPAGNYLFEVSAPMKLYLSIDGRVSVSVDTIQMTLTFETARSVGVGVRSYHQRPATTITTTEDPEDVVTAVSHLSNALKTPSAERAYPTLRGHPPELAVGDELDIPDQLDAPDTDITIVVPPKLGSAFVVAPLAYYLGAEVVLGSSPRIEIGDDEVHELSGPRGFENEVERVLKQTFFLDCVVRTEGIYVIPLRERKQIERRLEIDCEALYDMSPAEQLTNYLSIPYDELVDLVPRWKLTAHVAPCADSIETIPFLVNDLAVIKTPTTDEATASDEFTAAIEEFAGDGLLRRFEGARSGGPSDYSSVPDLVEPEQTDSIEQAWVGDDVPVGASKATAQAFRNSLDREEKRRDVNIVVVCNDQEMVDEHRVASEVYGSREELPFDVTLYENLTVDRLALVLESDIDFFHYIGHIEEDGFRCSDGLLDAASLSEVCVDTFFLNACRSYHQGMELIESGAVGGVVTLDEVINSGAISVGKAMARLLNRGFTLRAALTVASDRSIVGPQYIVVGDGNMDIAHAESPIPNLVEIHSASDDLFDVSYETYYSAHFGVGSVVRPTVSPDGDHFLVGSRHSQFTMDRERLREFFDLELVPVRIDGQLTWSDRVDVDKL